MNNKKIFFLTFASATLIIIIYALFIKSEKKTTVVIKTPPTDKIDGIKSQEEKELVRLFQRKPSQNKEKKLEYSKTEKNYSLITNILLDPNQNNHVKLEAIISLRKIKSEKARKILERFIEEDKLPYILISESIKSLANQENPGSLQVLLKKISYPNPIITGNAISAIGDIAKTLGPQAIEKVTQRLINEYDSAKKKLNAKGNPLTFNIVESLGKLGDPSSVNKLSHELINSIHFNLKKSIVRAMEKIKSPEAIPSLITHKHWLNSLDNPTKEVKSEISKTERVIDMLERKSNPYKN